MLVGLYRTRRPERKRVGLHQTDFGRKPDQSLGISHLDARKKLDHAASSESGAKNDIGTDVIKRKVMPLLSRLFPVQKPHAGCQFMRLYQQEATEEIEVAEKTKTWLTASLVSVRGSFYEFLDFMPLIFGAAILPMRK